MLEKETFKNYREEQIMDNFSRNRQHPMKMLIGLFAGNYGKLMGSMIFFIVKHSPVWVIPIATASIIDAATKPTDRSLVLIGINVAVMIVLILQNIPTNYMHTKLFSIPVRQMEAGLRGCLVRKLQQLSIGYHKQIQSGKLQSKIMRDVEQIETLASQLFVSMVTILLNVSVALVVTVSKSVVVFLFFLCSVPTAVLIMMLFRNKIKSHNSEFRREMEETSARVMEMVELVPVTRAHGLEQLEIHKMEQQLQTVAQKGYRLDMVQTYFSSISWCAFQVFQVGCLGFTGYLAYKGTISAGEVVLYQSYFASIVAQVTSVISLLPIIAKGMESVSSVADLLMAYDVEDYGTKKPVTAVYGAVDFEDVSFHYPEEDRNVLSHFNLRVGKGETIAFVGGSGSGKTTLLNLLIGFDKPTGGRICLDGEDMATLNLHDFRTHLSVVPQNTILFSGTLKENITYGQEHVSSQELEMAIEAANLKEMVEALPQGVDTLIQEHGGNLSGGQRQRIAIARAFLRNPSMIILDEATSALDNVSERKIQDSLQRLARGRTTFIVAHRLSTIKNAHRIVVIDNGQCVECGSYDELMAQKGAFYRMQNSQ